jgi:hypothetical protein
MSTEPNISATKQVEQSNDLQTILGYLQSPQGHELTSRLLAVVEDIKKSTLEKNSSHAAFEKWLQAGIIGLVVTASSVLAYLGKFDTSLGVLFGTLVGYIFGKK